MSTQISAECRNLITRKLVPPVPGDGAEQLLADYVSAWEVVGVEVPLVFDAVRLFRDNPLSYWDAQITAAAQVAGCPIVLSEDMQDDPIIAGIRMIKAFRDDFNVRSLIAA